MKTKAKKEAKSLGQQIDDLFALDKQIDDMEAELREVKRRRLRHELRMLNDFEKSDLDGAKGKMSVATIRRSRHPKIKDLKQFIKYVRERRAYDLFHRRISSKAYFDRLEEGEKIPGVEIFTSIGISVRKRKN